MNLESQEQNIRLTPDELQSLMRDAIARQGNEVRESERVGAVLTLQDALEAARELKIPEEHVLGAVKDQQRRKLREQRRWSVKASRRNAFWLGAGMTAIITVIGLLLGAFAHGFLSWLALPIIAFWLAVLYLGWRWLSPVSDSEADSADLIPIAGTCRVCGAPAYNPKASFCEEHRYKGGTSS